MANYRVTRRYQEYDCPPCPTTCNCGGKCSKCSERECGLEGVGIGFLAALFYGGLGLMIGGPIGLIIGAGLGITCGVASGVECATGSDKK